ncbi:MAG TPA: hypothetical protein VHG28_06815 [Longimicrobiaceae bacterium]|nr:hypothetical protein [Longimicrobiaceae bacterium]
MTDHAAFPLPVRDGTRLDEPYRKILRPGELMKDRKGRSRRLPRFFFEVPSWEAAVEARLSENFAVWEFLNVDVREAELLRTTWPRYVPCATTLIAWQLELLRAEVKSLIHIAANGGYRSPAHALSTYASTHCWGTAVNVYRIGDEYLDDQGTIQRINRLARKVAPAVRAAPYGHGEGYTDDHVHLDLGYSVFIPSDTPGEEEHTGEGPQDRDRGPGD